MNIADVSVIVATRDRSTLLREALASVLAGGEEPGEVIVVNDGGASVAAAVDGLAGTIRVIDTGLPKGQPAALNWGVRTATAPIVALCDDDDLFAPGHVAALCAVLRERAEAGLVYSSALAFADRPDRPLAVMDRPFNGARLRTSNYIVPSSVMFRRAVFERLGGFDERLTHYWDWDFYLRVAAAVRIHHLDRRLTYYRLHSESVQITAAAGERRRQLDHLCRRHGLGRLPLKHIVETFEPADAGKTRPHVHPRPPRAERLGEARSS